VRFIVTLLGRFFGVKVIGRFILKERKFHRAKVLGTFAYKNESCLHIRGDMIYQSRSCILQIEVYKILTNKYDSRVNLYLEKQQDSITRGHSLKLVNNRYH